MVQDNIDFLNWKNGLFSQFGSDSHDVRNFLPSGVNIFNFIDIEPTGVGSQLFPNVIMKGDLKFRVNELE